MKVQIGDATLYHGDCMDILPTLGKVDAVVTDPPYGLGDKWKGGPKWKLHHGSMEWDSRIVPGVIELSEFPECVIWGGNYYQLPPARGWLIWDKKQNDKFTSGQAELAWTNLDIPVRVFRMSQVEAYCGIEGKSHPTEKPVRLMMWLMQWIKSSFVLDPFMGSGTTGVACAHERTFIGIEKERKYFDIACERIEAAYAQGRLSL